MNGRKLGRQFENGLLADHLFGSVTTVSDNYGYQLDGYTYDAFGSLVQGNLSGSTDFGYLGKQNDSTSRLYNYGYRDYKPEVARFTTVDPIRDGKNWFAYVNNDPVNHIDIFGLFDLNKIISGANKIVSGSMKKKTLIYLFMVLIFIFLFFFVRYQKKIHMKSIDFNDSTIIKEGTVILYDSELKEIGTLEITKHDNNLICSINGNKTIGSYNGKQYVLQPYRKDNFLVKISSTTTENYYCFDDTDSYLFIFKLRKKNYKFLENYRKIDKKVFNLFMISLVSLEEYNFMYNNTTNMELQSLCGANQNHNLYTCFFIQ